MSKHSIKQRALAALRDQPEADCHVRDETGAFFGGTAYLEWMPVYPGTVKGTIGYIPVADDKYGHLKDAAGQLIASINYLTGEIKILSWRWMFSLSYNWDYYFDVNRYPKIQDFEIKLVSTQVRAVVHHVKANAKANVKIKSLSRAP